MPPLFDFSERDLRFIINGAAIHAINFDDDGGKIHGMTHCMNPVDFIIETNDYYYYVEFKDPDHPNATGTPQVAQFVNEVKDGTIKKELIRKYRDSFLYRWAEDKLNKPVKFCILLCCRYIDSAGYIQLQTELRRELPITRHSRWQRNVADNCVVLNLTMWNTAFPDWQVTRISAANAISSSTVGS